MRPESRWRILLIAEGPTDRRRIGVIVDHLIEGHAKGELQADARPVFEGLNGEAYIPIKRIPELARARGLDRRYSPAGPRKGDGGTLRKAHQVLQKEGLFTADRVIVWARDDDGDQDRRKDAEEARGTLPEEPRVLLAIASECGEAWSIAGFSPATPAEAAKLKAWRQRLGFAPQEQPHRLSHKENVPKSAKAVTADLFDGDDEREAAALIAAAGSGGPASQTSGLQAFCDEVRAWLIRG